MVSKKRRTNPFYVLLILAGVAFAITACGYGMMALREMRADPFAAVTQGEGSREMPLSPSFVKFFDQYGVRLMVWELALLGVATFAAIGTDRYWSGDAE